MGERHAPAWSERSAGRRPAANPLVGRVIETEVERIVPGGVGLAHAEGRTLFVGLAAPGDRVRARIERVRGGVAFASIVEVLAPGPARVEPPCPYFGRCGGCDFQQLAYPAQLEAKAGIIRDCLRRIAAIDPPPDVAVSPSPRDWDYRSRAEWQHDAARGLLGYFERDSHRVVNVTHCPIAAPEIEAALKELRGRMETGTLPAEIAEFRAAAGDDAVAIAPPLDDDRPAELVRTAGGERYRYDADCFFQTNHALLDPLVTEALRHVPPAATANGAAAPGVAVDLYCGVGLFTLPLARRFERVIGVEAHHAAAAYATQNLVAAGLGNARVDAVGVEPWLTRHASVLAPPAFVLLDPPRTGAGDAVVEGILALRPGRIAYVSCDPATLARDLRRLLGGGYALDGVTAFDLFPQTHHVETVAHLIRAG